MVNVLNLLDTIIIAGKQKRTDEEEVAIKEMLPFLQKIAFHDSNNNLSQTAYNICVNILNRNAIQGSGLSVDSPHQIGGQTLEDVIEFTDKSYLTGDSPAMKAFGLRQLSNFISKSKSEVCTV